MRQPARCDHMHVAVEGHDLFGGQPVDGLGNPMVRIDPCPSCGRGAGWMHPIEYAAVMNSGRDPHGPCSRRCALQIEWAQDRDAVVAEGAPRRSAP